WLGISVYRADVRDFLISRRERITPEQVGLPTSGTRKVAGLRRGEVAILAGISVEYYTKLERGQIIGASSEVLHSLAQALKLNEAVRARPSARAMAASPVGRPPKRRRTRGRTPTPGLQWALDALTAGPASVRNGHMHLLSVNTLARAFYNGLY